MFLRTVYCLLFFLLTQHSEAQIAGAASLQDISAIKLKRANGKEGFIHFEKGRLQVLFFLSPECPLCKNYSIVLNELQEKFQNAITVNGIVPGSAYTGKEVQEYIKDYNIRFPVWIDRKKELANTAKATVTPEVVVVNDSGNIIYRGAIDDWVQELGKKKLKPQEFYLRNAIEQYFRGEPVTINQTIPKGCFINEY